MRTRVRAPLATPPTPSQVPVVPDAPQRQLGANGGAIADLLLATLHLPQSPIGTAEHSPETRPKRSSVLHSRCRLARKTSPEASAATGMLASCGSDCASLGTRATTPIFGR